MDVPGGNYQADEGIVNLLAYYNDRGIGTQYSCQGGRTTSNDRPSNGYIYFTSVDTLPAFLAATEELLQSAKRFDLLRRLRGLDDTADDLDADQQETPGNFGQTWQLAVSFNTYRAGQEIVDAEARLGRMLTRNELVERGRRGWVYMVRIPADDLLTLDRLAGNHQNRP